MTLNPEQIEAVQQGEAVPVLVDDTECVVVRKDIYDRVQRVIGDALDAETVHSLMEQTMAEDDAQDPSLESYQQYKR